MERPSAESRDREALQRLADLLAAGTPSLAALRSAVGGEWLVRDLGFGASAETGGEPAASLTIRVDAICHEGQVVRLTAGVYWYAEPGPAQLAALQEVLGARLTRRPDAPAACATREDEAALAALHQAREAVLGAPPACAVPAALAPALAVLTEVGSLIVGERCGFAGRPTPGHAATTALVAARRADLLAAALRGATAGGRVFAARALLRGGNASADDERVIALLRAMPTPITACTGCTHWGTTAAKLLGEPRGQPS